jgi:hypothetical protein
MFRLCEHAPGPIQRFYQNFTKVSLTLWTMDGWTRKLCYCSTSKLCIYTDYMVAFGNNTWMYYIEKLNNGEFSLNRKRLSIKYSFKCAKQPLSSLHCRYYVCEHLRTCGQYRVNREDVSNHCFMYLYFISTFFIAYLILFYCISFLIIGWNEIILLWRICKMVESTMLYWTFACSCVVRSFM